MGRCGKEETGIGSKIQGFVIRSFIMTDLNIFESGLNCTDELAQVLALCERTGQYCLIGGLALNVYCEPVFTADADIVLSVDADKLLYFREELKQIGFKTKLHRYWLSANKKSSSLQIQITRDARYGEFPQNAVRKDIFGISAMVASIEDLTKGKLMAYASADRSETKKAKDRLDLIRIGVKYYEKVCEMLPEEVLAAVRKDLNMIN